MSYILYDIYIVIIYHVIHISVVEKLQGWPTLEDRNNILVHGHLQN